MFTESLEKDDLQQEEAFVNFQASLDKRLSKKKNFRIMDFAEYPLPITSICESLVSDLARVFEAGDARFDISAPKEKGGDKLQKVLDDLDLVAWVKNEGLKVLQSKPHTIVVIDKDENGEPFLLPIYLDRLIDFKLKDDGYSFEYIMFQHSKDDKSEKIALYTSEEYIVSEKKKGESDYTLERRVKHDIGYCPARMFWDIPLNTKEPFLKKTPLVSSLGLLSIWTQFQVFKVYSEYTTPFPVVEMIAANCGDYECENGYIVKETNLISSDGSHHVHKTKEPCKTCEEINNIAIGTTIKIPARQSNEDPSYDGVFRFIPIDINGVKYLGEMLDKVEKVIRSNVVGGVVDNTTEAVNEKQVQGNFERRANVLSILKNSLENLQYWIVETLVKIVSPKSFVSISIDYGTQWYLLSTEEIQNKYSNAIEKGLPKEEIALIYYQMIETKYKNNPLLIQKLKLINLLDPCPYDNFDKKNLKLQIGLITLEDFYLSENIFSLIERFESENGSIVEFGSQNSEMNKHNKIEAIKATLYSYINLSQNARQSNQKSNEAESL